MNYLKNPRSWIIASFLVGLALTMTGWVWWEFQTPQSQWYNRGMLAYNTGNYDLAVQDFDRSIVEFNSDPAKAKDPGYFNAAPSVSQAGDAQFYKFMSLMKMKNAKLAIIAIKESLKLTTEENLSHYKLTDSQLKAIREQRILYQTNLEILFHQKKEMQDGEGKGNGKGQPKPGDKQSEDPSNNNANGSGKTPRDAL